MDFISLAEEIGRHLRIPVPGLVTEVNPGLQHVTHGGI
jgi:hypothetical protein